MVRRPLRSSLFLYTTLFRSESGARGRAGGGAGARGACRHLRLGLASLRCAGENPRASVRSEEHTSELQSRLHLVCRLLLEKKNSVLTEPFGGRGFRVVS